MRVVGIARTVSNTRAANHFRVFFTVQSPFKEELRRDNVLTDGVLRGKS
jgi:hypothetical protein